MHDQRVEARPALGGEDAGDGALVGRVGAEPVDRLGRERDELSAAQQRGGAGDRLGSGGDDPFHRATLSARRCSRKIGAGKRWRKHMIDKFVRSVAEAMAGIKDGSTVLVAGFAQIGEPRALIDGLIEQGAKDLTVVHNTAGRGREGVARLIGEGRVRKIVCSFARSRGSVLFEEVYARGEIELEIVPQGTLAERIRAGGAGIPAFFTPTGGGTSSPGQGSPRHRRPRMRAGAGDPRRCRAGRGVARRPLGQPRLSRRRAELQPGRARRPAS